MSEKPRSATYAANEGPFTKEPSQAIKKLSSEEDAESLSSEAQGGVQAMEATAKVWTQATLIVAYVFIWVIYFVDSMQMGTTGLLTPYVTSNFALHSLTPTVGIMSSIIGGVSKLTLAKILDVFGRPQGYLISVLLATLGLVMMAATKNVEMFAAAQVFYWVGMNGIGYALSVALADMSSLKNRGLALAFSTSPFIITTWLNGRIAAAFYKVHPDGTNSGPGFRWAFGAFSIITPAVTLPLFVLFVFNLRKAIKLGVITKAQSTRTPLQSFVHYCREFDIVGLLLISAGLSIFLLPFNIYSFQSQEWRAPIVICFFIFGGLLIIGFAVWEKYFAPVKFLPYELLLDRTVLGSCVLPAISFISFYIWNSFFGSFLQVVMDLDLTTTGYITQTYNVGSCFFALIVGLLIRHTGNYKWPVLFFGLPITVIGVGTMIKFRAPGTNIGFIVMSQIFVAFGGGTNVVCQQVAIMSVVKHQHIAVVLAIQSMAASIGGGIGRSISGAIWQGVFPGKLREYLPEAESHNWAKIYGDITVQLSYPVGSPTRSAIQAAYADGQRAMLIGATAIFAIGFVAVAFWRNINVKSIKQVKGLVF
ncbi:hypothetical protein NLG97_g3339 [Lecanicillium saksenae]|uniref:Uncharacterized protein n=1 Tax=Lecanicillium saksenae TaxID=468837 RepID=A0ACC1R1R1_9HYPO|nr:hypothetical protein NLG97_g3339 [Lecanicillium saksenae]